MSVIFVTGGGGYVGSHCILQLLEEGYQVVAIDNFENSVKGHDDMPESLYRVQKLTGKTLKFHQVDLLDKQALKDTMKQYDISCVLHLAANKSVAESCQVPIKYYVNNVVGSVNLIQVMNDLGVYKLVFSSSCTVYGKPKYLPIDEEHPIGDCTNPYGKSKVFLEQVIKDMNTANQKWNAIMLRYFNPVGVHPSGEIGEDPNGVPSNLMPYVAQVAVGRRDKLTIYGADYETKDGTCVRDYIHVMDIADGHVKAVKKILDKDFNGIKAYNLASGKGSSVFDLIQCFEKASGVKIAYEVAEKRPGDVPVLFASCEVAKKELGWKAEKNLQQMCEDSWRWQSKYPMGYATQK